MFQSWTNASPPTSYLNPRISLELLVLHRLLRDKKGNIYTVFRKSVAVTLGLAQGGGVHLWKARELSSKVHRHITVCLTRAQRIDG